MKRNPETVNRIVIKIGTGSLVMPNGKINLEKIDQLAFVISSLMNKGKDVILVSPGAMGFGLNVLNMDKRPTEIARQQAVLSVGQAAMMSLCPQTLSHYQTEVSQLLITRDAIEYPESLENFTNASEMLLKMGIVPIVNENDAISVDEMGHTTKSGDNDRLSAIVAKVTKVDLLIMLLDIDGLCDKNSNTYDDAKLCEHVTEITDEIIKSAGGAGGKFGTGGTLSRIKGVQMISDNNSQMILMNGANPRDILKALEGANIGTWFSQVN